MDNIHLESPIGIMFRRMNAFVKTSHSQRLWPVFALLIAVVVLPTAVVFWFVNQAMQNEQLAMRQRLTELYGSQLHTTAERIQEAWHDRFDQLSATVQRHSAQEAFALLVKDGLADSVLVYQNEALVYPKAFAFSGISAEPQTPSWLEARSLEFRNHDPKAAAAAYAGIVRQSADVREAARALVSQARCLNQAGRQSEAIGVLVHSLGGARYRTVRDAQGRSISLNALLFGLQLMKESSHPSFQKTAAFFADRLNDYQGPVIPSAQRRFLMEQLKSLWPDCPNFPTFAAEELAAHFEKKGLDQLTPGQVQQTEKTDIWAYLSPDRSFVALFSHNRLMAHMDSIIARQTPAGGMRLSAIQPGSQDSSFQTEVLGDLFPSWRLALNPGEGDPFRSAAMKRATAYVWIGILMTAGIILLSALLAVHLRRQMRLTRLKNDLIATVSHELKTPLSSMRLLVDTLRDGHSQDTQLVQEYLQMISKENARLSSLIEGFLAFSRMERKKANFERGVLQPSEIVHAALEAVENRLHAPGCRLDLDLAPEIPPIIGDREAMITVFVNLLDNAIKYTGENKEIRLRGFASNGSVWFEVQDNGIGFPRSAAIKIFDRFYQVDRTLSRQTGGCGLGLSIVQFIVAAHNGKITAKSQPGKGSTFTIQLPAAG